jgi:hypothetical protein
MELSGIFPPSGSSLLVKAKILLCRMNLGDGVDPLLLPLSWPRSFARSGRLYIHIIDVGRRPTRDASVPSGGSDNVNEQGFGCCKIMLVSSISGVSE